MKIDIRYSAGLTVLLTTTILADPPESHWLQLNEMNQTYRHNLHQQQKAFDEQQVTDSPSVRLKRQQLFRQQRLQQQSLQHSQLHQRLIQDQQNRINPAERPNRLEGIFRQQRFRRDQQRQLQRFQLQQQLQAWPR